MTDVATPLHGGSDMRCVRPVGALHAVINERATGLPLPLVLGCLRVVEHEITMRNR